MHIICLIHRSHLCPPQSETRRNSQEEALPPEHGHPHKDAGEKKSNTVIFTAYECYQTSPHVALLVSILCLARLCSSLSDEQSTKPVLFSKLTVKHRLHIEEHTQDPSVPQASKIGSMCFGEECLGEEI